MGILNRLFRSTEATAKEIELDDAAIAKAWKRYLEVLSYKKDLILRGGFGAVEDLNRVKKQLTLELTDLSRERKTESQLISDLEAIEHSKKVKRVQRLEQCLGYARTKHEYVYQLLRHLHSILQTEMNIVRRLLYSSRNRDRLVSHLRSQVQLELEIVAQIQKIKSFRDLFLALVKGEHIIHTMDAAEKKLLKKMDNEMSKIFSGETTKGITLQWVQVVFDAIENKALEAVDAGTLEFHPDMDFEFVNRPEFVELVRESRQEFSGRKVSEKMITVFTHLFREWYNHERD